MKIMAISLPANKENCTTAAIIAVLSEHVISA